MSKQRKAAYGAPQEQKEVVITMDRRLAVGATMAGLLVVALAGGMWWARQDAGVASSPPAATVDPIVAATLEAQRHIDAAMTQGLPTSVQIVQRASTMSPEELKDNPFNTPVVPPLPASQPQSTVDPQFVPTPPPFDVIPGGTEIAFPPNTGGPMDAAQAAVFKDPNLTDDVIPLRPEALSAPVAGPRIGISPLNEFYTYNFGIVPINQVVEHDFELSNVGDEDLVVSRIYAGCGCTATVFGGVQIKADGFLPEPVTLAPGDSRPFTVQFDPRAEGKKGTQMKYIQIYSNDTTRFQYEDGEPLSHEIRFRIVVQPE